MLELRVGILQVHWDRIMQPGLNASGLKFAADPVTFVMKSHEEVPDMPAVMDLRRELEWAAARAVHDTAGPGSGGARSRIPGA